MRLQRGVSTFAAIATTAALAASPAQAKFDNTTYPPLGAPRSVVTHHAGSTDWALIAVSAAGGVALAGAGVGASRRRGRRGMSTARARTASGS